MWMVLGLIALGTYIVVKWVSKNFDFFEKQGVKFVKPYPLIGTNTWLLGRENIAVILKKFYDQFPNEKIFGLFNFAAPFYVIRDPDLIKHLAVKEFENFSNHMKFVDTNHDEFFGSMLTTLRDKKWKEMRSALSPIFTGSKMRMMFELMSEVGEEMSEYFWEKYSNQGPVAYDIKNIFSRFTNDVIATCAFGVKCDSFRDPSNEFFKIGQSFVRFSSPLQMMKFLLIRYFPKTSRTFGLMIFSKDNKNLFYKMIIENMNTREKNNIHRPDLINLLMQIRKGELHHEDGNDDAEHESIAAVKEEIHNHGNISAKKLWTDNEIIAQCFLFFIAGFETSSATLRYLAYELATNPEVQEKLVTEIDKLHENLDGSHLSYEKIQSLKYLDMVISETLRKWPAAFTTDRQCSKDFTYKGDDGLEFNLEKDMVIWIPIYGLHMDPKYYPEPEKFDPERFDESNRHNLNLNAYLPFGIGPRNCIGSRFALMEMKIAIYYLLLKFTFEVGPETQVPLKLKRTPNGLQPDVDVKLRLQPRHV
ncbi:unnamed protein product [Hermetia illucens]|uniref:Cytochrome P450 n=1 Tax=Hermetia illucens TaxID=343691 RepID=A0A7R8UPX4_HERIL|nr:probable cytochrome P450 9f2 [Hermetia illucens]CAD7084746.1 unnamed protein product [Hermetia illucens]